MDHELEGTGRPGKVPDGDETWVIPKIVELAIDWNLDSWYKVIRNRMKQSVNADHSVSEAMASPISLDKSIRIDRLAHL